MPHLYDFLLLLASFVPPAPAYKALPRDVVEGLAWTWIVIVYGVFLAVAVTTFSVRVLGTSTRCLPTCLRVLLLTVTVVSSEVFAAIYMMPATTLTVVGTCFTVLLLLAAHLIACRRHH